MKFLYKIAVASEAAQTWEKMQDTLAMVHCIPGVRRPMKLRKAIMT